LEKQMDMERIAMSQRERDVLKVMAEVEGGVRTQREAGRLIRRTIRQVRRIQRRLEAEGDGGIIHKLRGRPSNARIDPEHRQRVLEVYRADYGDFGPTLAAEKLVERGLAIRGQTLRLWLLAEGFWERKRRRDVHRQRRARRECFGELVQADGSPHDWLEGRGPMMTLLVMIDDATSKVVARFAPAETTVGYLDLLGRYLRKHGRMLALYTDRHSIFWGEDYSDDPQPGHTQFNRALQELGIDWIPAHSPQAKGRVERFNATAQDRLVKELRLAKAATIEHANAVLEATFLPWFNRWCIVKPVSGNDAHRSIQPGMNLAGILCVQETRTVANDYTFRLDNQVYQLPPPPLSGLRRGKVIVERRLDGSLHVRFKGRYLRYQLVAATAAQELGALPPNPRSLTLSRIPAGSSNKQGCATEATQPSAVHPTVKRSGRTPALPYPPDGNITVSTKPPYRPPPSHPWRNKPVISI
jgi:transposase